MTLSFSGLKDGDEAESLKHRNLYYSKDSEEVNVQPVIVDDHNVYSSRKGNISSGGAEEDLVVTLNTMMQKSME